MKHCKHSDVEEWIVIEHPNIIRPYSYEVSNKGRVKNVETGKILSPWINTQTGYYMVALPTILREDNGKFKFKKFTVHSLVHNHFTTEPEKIYDERYIVNHKDGVKTNCYATNLEWVTVKENNIHAVNMGLCLTGEDAIGAKSSNEKVHEICKLLELDMSYKDILETLNLPNDNYHRSLLIRIRTGKQWKLISKQYNIKQNSRLRKYSDDDIDKICQALEHGMDVVTMYHKYAHPDQSIKDFRKLINNIEKRACYKDISDNYNWWRKFND